MMFDIISFIQQCIVTLKLMIIVDISGFVRIDRET